MAGRGIPTVELREILRRLRAGETVRRIGRDLGIARNTVAKHARWARQVGILDAERLAEAKEIAELRAKDGVREVVGPASTVAPHEAFVREKREEGVEIRAIHQLLKEQGYGGSYSSVRRFVQRLEERVPEVFVRVETAPGEEAQVDFGYAGLIPDRGGAHRKSWVFVMALSYSRHLYTEVVFDQTVETWVALHVRAFEYFGGCVQRVTLDNLKAAIVRAVLHDPEPQRSYRALAEHYGFLISPCRVRTPRHKGKVESGVHSVCRNALAGRSFSSLEALNAHLRRWMEEIAGLRDHGTTHEKPLERFTRERPHLLALPSVPYEVTTWQRARVHRDCYVVFDSSYYSVPHRLVGETVWVQAAPGSVVIHHDHMRIASHSRAMAKGERHTQADHLPPEKCLGLRQDPLELRARAVAIGSATEEVVARFLKERPMDRHHAAQAVLGFGRRFGAPRLEAACRRALTFGDTRYQVIRGILEKGLDFEAVPDDPWSSGPLPSTSQFARPLGDFLPQAVREGA